MNKYYCTSTANPEYDSVPVEITDQVECVNDPLKFAMCLACGHRCEIANLGETGLNLMLINLKRLGDSVSGIPTATSANGNLDSARPNVIRELRIRDEEV